MSRFKSYSPDQAYLLPPSVRDELGGNHLCFFVRGVVERLDMTMFEQSYGVYERAVAFTWMLVGLRWQRYLADAADLAGQSHT
jgi:hypothetical protein